MIAPSSSCLHFFTVFMNKIVIVKLGGAAITNKKGICELAPENDLSILLDQVAAAYEILKRTGHQLILVHGAGSFGHPQAVKYNLKSGWSSSSSTGTLSNMPNANYLKGYSHIRNCLQILCQAIASKLEALHVPALTMSPIDYIETVNCEDTPTSAFKAMADRAKSYLSLGFVPVLHGDAVFDQIRGCTILSGDIIMYQLTRLLPQVCRCVFITDVCGIYKLDPKLHPEQENKLIQHIKVSATTTDNHQQPDQPQQHQQHDIISVADVTGGMQGKVRWAKKIVSHSQQDLDTVICKWGTDEALDIMTLKAKLTPNALMTIITRN
ncbi:amino acid kinase [Mucor ambiguus]|uniref:Isopentenyl phosphate kinase n=1 Tax=Mucor ambiguus TaxID=91626 RepID=A0A0C9MHG9_9FUNG|nr:amino acid kinase [Mucor ambiguus]